MGLVQGQRQRLVVLLDMRLLEPVLVWWLWEEHCLKDPLVVLQFVV